MVLGLVLIGMLAGGTVAVSALIAGQSLWVAFALYAGIGAATVTLTALGMAVSCWFHVEKSETDMQQLAGFEK